MEEICILTDSSAQFPQHTFAGQELVRIIPHDVFLSGKNYPEGKELKPANFPWSAVSGVNPKLIPPSPEKFIQWITSFSQEFRQFLIILHSSHFNLAYANALEAAASLKGSFNIQVVNSQTTSAGLGIIVQKAAESIIQGADFTSVEHLVRKQVPHVFSLFCAPGLSYLAHSGLISHPQAIAGEMLNMLPIFTIEDERLTPLEKVRGYRNTIELFIEFLDEFENLSHIAIIQSTPPLLQDVRSLRQMYQEIHPHGTFSEHNLNVPLATLFGPRLIGLIAAEVPD